MVYKKKILCEKISPPTCKTNYVNMQDNYVGMQDNNDNMQDNYVTVAEMIFFPTWMVRERKTNAKCTQSSE